MFRLAAVFIAAPILLIGACGSPQSGTSEDGTPVLSYEDAYVMAPIGGRDVTVGGISITARGGDVRLTGVTSEIADTVETHSMAMVDDRMQMRRVDGWDIADGETLSFERGGDHLMFFGVNPSIASGDTANVTFYFDVSGREDPLTLEAEADIRAVGE